jgi:hypothetical protein
VNGRADELLLEAAVTAFRERDTLGRIVASPAFMDLSEEDREELARRQLGMRELERVLHPRGWSSTVEAVMNRIV